MGREVVQLATQTEQVIQPVMLCRMIIDVVFLLFADVLKHNELFRGQDVPLTKIFNTLASSDGAMTMKIVSR